MRITERLRPDIVNEAPSKRALAETAPHRIFELELTANGIDGALELVGGPLLLFLSPVAITGHPFTPSTTLRPLPDSHRMQLSRSDRAPARIPRGWSAQKGLMSTSLDIHKGAKEPLGQHSRNTCNA
jgi:hypothetical protein